MKAAETLNDFHFNGLKTHIKWLIVSSAKAMVPGSGCGSWSWLWLCGWVLSALSLVCLKVSAQFSLLMPDLTSKLLFFTAGRHSTS